MLGLLPIVQVRVARALVRFREPARDARQEVEDIAQDVFAALFSERHAGAILKSTRRSPWTESPADLFEIETELGEDVGPGIALESKDLLETLFDMVRETLTPRGLELFELLVVREESVEEVCVATGMTPDAVYAWRSRLIKVARTLGNDLMKKVSSSRIATAVEPAEDA